MKISLLIPECKTWHNRWYCEASDDIDQRIKILEHTVNNAEDTELIITSHNFFAFYPDSRVIVRQFIEDEIIARLHERVEKKKPLIIGFDLLTPNPRVNRTKKEKTQRKTKGSNLSVRFNPYDRGIDALVCYIKVEHNSYVYGTHIWECWEEMGECSKIGIKDQYEKRVISLSGVTIGLLSCGDIANYCHDEGKLLPNPDIYVDLSHKSLRGWTSQNRIPLKLIRDWKKCSYVLVTQQVKDISSYLKNKRYPYIFPKSVKHKVQELFINGRRKGVFVDIDIP